MINDIGKRLLRITYSFTSLHLSLSQEYIFWLKVTFSSFPPNTPASIPAHTTCRHRTKMCFLEHPRPVYYPACRHTVPSPEQPTPRQCVQFYGTSNWHSPLTSVHLGSSKRRNMKCPDCIDREKEAQARKDQQNKKDEDQGQGMIVRDPVKVC